MRAVLVVVAERKRKPRSDAGLFLLHAVVVAFVTAGVMVFAAMHGHRPPRGAADHRGPGSGLACRWPACLRTATRGAGGCLGNGERSAQRERTSQHNGPEFHRMLPPGLMAPKQKPRLGF